MSTRFYDDRDERISFPRREVRTAPRARDSYDDYEDSRAMGRQPWLVRRTNSLRSDRTLVPRDETRGRPTRFFSPDRRHDSRIIELEKPRIYRDVEDVTYGSGAIERRPRPASPPPIRTRIVERDRSESFDRARYREEMRRQRERERAPLAPTEVINNFVDEEGENSTVRNKASSKRAQIVLGPEFDRDTSIHLELDIEADVDGLLEEFSHLKRLGNFHAAEQYFQTNLREYLNVPPIAIEYAEMLLRQGAYQRLKDLLEKQELSAPLPPRSRSPSPHRAPVPVMGPSSTRGKDRDIREQPAPPGPQAVPTASEITYNITRMYQGRKIKSNAERFDVTLNLIEVTAEMRSQGRLRRALIEAEDAEEVFYMNRRRKAAFEDSSLSSTEVQIINFWHDIQSHLSIRSDLVDSELDSNASPFSDWPGLYDFLREGGRIWELRDVISSSLATFGGKETWANMFSADIYDVNFLESFLDDWGINQEYDESTFLAMLTILVDLCQELLYPSSDTDAVATAERCLEHAKAIATCIKENDARNVKSRPYISWIIIEKELQRKFANTERYISSEKPGFNTEYLQSLPGLVVGTSTLPIYVPIKSENPGWPISEQPPNSDDLLQHALKASQELGDYTTEVACLREMICRSPKPKQLFERLVHVQKTLQGDMVGYLETLLSKYLLVTDAESRQSLLNELTMFNGHKSISYDIQDPLINWCQRVVQAALYRSSGRYPVETKNLEQEAQDLIYRLPSDMYDRAVERGFPRRMPIERETIYVDRSPTRHASPSPPPPPPVAPTLPVEIERGIVIRERGGETYRPRFEDKREIERPRFEEKREIEIPRLRERPVRREVERPRFEEREIEPPRFRERPVRREIERPRYEERGEIERPRFEERRRQERVENEKKNGEEERKHPAGLEPDLQTADSNDRRFPVMPEIAPTPETIRTIHARLARRDVSLEALNRFRIRYELDKDPDYVLLKDWVPEDEKAFLRNQTKFIRSRRGGAQTVVDLEAPRRTMSPTKVHQASASSEETNDRTSRPQVIEEIEEVDINQSSSPRVMDSKLDSGEANASNTHSDKPPNQHDNRPPSPPRASRDPHPQEKEFPPPSTTASFVKDNDGKGKGDGDDHDETYVRQKERGKPTRVRERAVHADSVARGRPIRIREEYMQSSGSEDNENNAASDSADKITVSGENSPTRKPKEDQE